MSAPSTAPSRPAARRSGSRSWSATAARARSSCCVRRSRHERGARHLLRRARGSRPRLAVALDAERRGEGRDQGVPRTLVSELTITEREGRVGVVLMNRPKQLNALSGELMGALVSDLQAFDAD